MNIQGHVALVTGGASGIGLATVQRLVNEGAKKVVVADVNPPKDEVATELGDAIKFAQTDVTNEDQVAAAMHAAAELGDLRAVVHSAGNGGPVRLLQKDGSPSDLAHLKRSVDVSLMG